MHKLNQISLLRIGGLFLALQAMILSLAPAVRVRSWTEEYPMSHWLVPVVWAGLTYLAHNQRLKRSPESDMFIFPVIALLSGWGILTIWRVSPEFGARQTLWFILGMAVYVAGMRVHFLKSLQRYKYVLLSSGVILTAFTLLFGTNPGGFGPRLWLGCCDIYFQPSEPLKLLLIVFLAAYFSEKLPYRLTTLFTLFPTIVLGGLVILLLLAQRDLGTACIFLALYTIMAYLATHQKIIIAVNLAAIILTGFAGYFLVDIIQYRIESWIYPWGDPQGGSYQIIQSLMAIANGGIEGRGLGLGSPGIIPVAISDFVYASIAEETGLIGTLGLLALLGILITRSFRIAFHAPDLFQRYLASGIGSYFGVQSILIIGGNIRLLPLTGVTLPFVSYGGSSLLTSFLAVLILLQISHNSVEVEAAPLENPYPYLGINLVLLGGLFAAGLATGWWAVIRGPDLQTRSDNLRLVIEERYVPRGSILDTNNLSISTTIGERGFYSREYVYTELAPVTGYNDPIYGRVGLEASLDEYLRGRQGSPASAIWLNHLLYGMSPPGLDVRLSIDLRLQQLADEMMSGKRGAVILMNAESGEILVMASHPTFDPNQLDANAAELLNNENKPLINRAVMGYYPAASALQPFAKALFGSTSLQANEWDQLYADFRFLQTVIINMDVLQMEDAPRITEFHTSPLHMALAASALSHDGIMPAPRITTAVNTPREGWVVLPAAGMPVEVYPPSVKEEAVLSFIENGNAYWSHIAFAKDEENIVTWFIGGTPPEWPSAPLAVVVVLEEKNAVLAEQIADMLLENAIGP